MKFGGTSVGSPQRMKEVADIVSAEQGKRIVVLSALSGTTNTLVSISENCTSSHKPEARAIAEELKVKYYSFLDELFGNTPETDSNKAFADEVFELIDHLIDQNYNDQVNKMLLAQGEIMSTHFFTDFMNMSGRSCEMIMAADYMTLDENAEPSLSTTRTKLNALLAETKSEVIITQGYIARNAAGGMDNLRRGGSDYTATIIGAVLKSEEVQIWTDIDGMHNNDPRIVKNTHPLANLSFEEASELAYFGAKVLHPHCIIPAQQHEVPVRIKNTMDPEAHGTLISAIQGPGAVKAIAAKDNITAIKIKSSRMVMAYGFLKRIFEVFESYKTPIDMITTSEIAVSLTIDNPEHLDKIIAEISKFGKVEVDHNQTIICIVGDMVAEHKGVGSKIFLSLDDVPLRMISYGGSRNNISLLVSEEYKQEALLKLHAELF